MPHIPDWLTPLVDAAILLPVLMAMVRLAGLRSFAKLSAHDFAVTVATGSIVAGTVLDPGAPWWMGLIGLASLLAVQIVLSAVRVHVPRAQRRTDNEPLVLVRDGEMDRDAMRAARVTPDDLRQKLRQAGIARWREAGLVVMETTGDFSILRDRPQDDLLAEVRGVGPPPS